MNWTGGNRNQLKLGKISKTKQKGFFLRNRKHAGSVQSSNAKSVKGHRGSPLSLNNKINSRPLPTTIWSTSINIPHFAGSLDLFGITNSFKKGYSNYIKQSAISKPSRKYIATESITANDASIDTSSLENFSKKSSIVPSDLTEYNFNENRFQSEQSDIHSSLIVIFDSVSSEKYVKVVLELEISRKKLLALESSINILENF
ncbi:hypothetical protein BB561_003558 [Smittium simulii]|uniref:Uncharacterized protein n=1 Tax=Smittium simulii TaxID=133385 RepID=A0A2T9YKU2_9FUNG|nr:hypothetical protein BB561_003558 [Smittium simulii]